MNTKQSNFLKIIGITLITLFVTITSYAKPIALIVFVEDGNVFNKESMKILRKTIQSKNLLSTKFHNRSKIFSYDDCLVEFLKRLGI